MMNLDWKNILKTNWKNNWKIFLIDESKPNPYGYKLCRRKKFLFWTYWEQMGTGCISDLVNKARQIDSYTRSK